MASAVTRVYNGGLRAELVRGALPLKLKAFSHLFGRPMKAEEFATCCIDCFWHGVHSDVSTN